jgi:hypothetical protein
LRRSAVFPFDIEPNPIGTKFVGGFLRGSSYLDSLPFVWSRHGDIRIGCLRNKESFSGNEFVLCIDWRTKGRRLGPMSVVLGAKNGRNISSKYSSVVWWNSAPGEVHLQEPNYWSVLEVCGVLAAMKAWHMKTSYFTHYSNLRRSWNPSLLRTLAEISLENHEFRFSEFEPEGLYEFFARRIGKDN